MDSPSPPPPRPVVELMRPVTAARPPAETARFAFNGRAGEYFRIWIVNVSLSILTLGVYSAWAKVRMKRYVYGHTLLADLPFSYDANPRAILRGRVIAAALVGLWVGLGYVSPIAQSIVLLPLSFLVPWLIVASFRFKTRASSYRNVGFSFDGTYGGAYSNYVGLNIAAAFTLYLLWPWVVYRRKMWVVDSTLWGDQRLGFWGTSSSFYRAHLPSFIAVAIFWVLLLTVEPRGSGWMDPFFVATVVGYALFAAMAYWTYARVQKLVLDGVHVGGARLVCTMEPLRYTWISLSNWFLALVTLGLLHPWGEVRRLKYLTSRLVVEGYETLDGAQGERSPAGSAAGDEIVGAFDLDAGF